MKTQKIIIAVCYVLGSAIFLQVILGIILLRTESGDTPRLLKCFVIPPLVALFFWGLVTFRFGAS